MSQEAPTYFAKWVPLNPENKTKLFDYLRPINQPGIEGFHVENLLAIKADPFAKPLYLNKVMEFAERSLTILGLGHNFPTIQSRERSASHKPALKVFSNSGLLGVMQTELEQAGAQTPDGLVFCRHNSSLQNLEAYHFALVHLMSEINYLLFNNNFSQLPDPNYRGFYHLEDPIKAQRDRNKYMQEQQQLDPFKRFVDSLPEFPLDQ